METLQQATLAASHHACFRKPKPVRRAKWFDSKVQEALQDLRRSRKWMNLLPNNHNALRYHVARKQFHYQVVLVKRSHTRQFAASVTPGTDLWRLTAWYQGVRKTTIPTLKDLTSDLKFPIWISESKDKATLLTSSWFPNRNSNINPLTPTPRRPPDPSSQ